MLSEHSRVLLQSFLKLAVFPRVDLVLEVTDLKLATDDVKSELLLVHIRLRDESEIHIGHQDGTHAPLFHNIARLSLELLVEIKLHRHASHTKMNSKVSIALLIFRRGRIADQVDCEMRLLQVNV